MSEPIILRSEVINLLKSGTTSGGVSSPSGSEQMIRLINYLEHWAKLSDDFNMDDLKEYVYGGATPSFLNSVVDASGGSSHYETPNTEDPDSGSSSSSSDSGSDSGSPSASDLEKFLYN